MARKKICDLDDAILVKKFCLKDLGEQRSTLMASRERKETYIRRREVALLGREVRGGGDGEVTTLVLVEDASEDRGGVEIGNAVGLDWINWSEREPEIDWDQPLGAPEPSKLTCKRRISGSRTRGKDDVVAHECGSSEISDAVKR